MSTRGQPLGTTRGQSEVVGVALLLGVTMLALGALTATVGGIVDQQVANADAARVADDLDDALQPVTTTGSHRGTVSFSAGRLEPVEREVRVLDASGVVRTIDADALVYRAGDRRVAFIAGAIARGTGDNARFVRDPPVTVDDDVLVVGVPALNTSGRSVAAKTPTTVVLRSAVSHDRSVMGDGEWGVAVETTTTAPWRAYFERLGANVSTTDFDDDGTPSVVARFDGRRRAYLVVHHVRLEVTDGE